MSNRIPRLFFPILILIILTIWISWPNNPGIHFFGINRSIDTKLGLDLVGGVQALLEADLPANSTVSTDAMSTPRAIVENRVNGLGVSEAVVQLAGDRRIIVELPGEKDPQKALETIQQTGLLEFVDFTNLDLATISSLESTQKSITTDFAKTTAPITSSNTVSPTAVYHTVMTGADLKNVNVSTSQTGEYEVAFQLSSTGKTIFADFTTKNVGKILAIVLDKKIISAPKIQNPITDGQGVITGNFTNESANALAIQLRYGSLPIPLKVVTSQTVGPTLGQDSLRKSLIAGILGLSVVILFMALYYRLPGVVADVALLIYALISYSIFRMVPVTLTLPGIAGFVLSIGVAVDANVLIFERLREELRNGRTLRQAIDIGWQRAFPSIRDSNISTLITCLILFIFGSTYGASIVKGFSLTLAIGVLVSLFTAIIVTRTILHLVLDNIQAAEHPSLFAVRSAE